MCYVSLCFSLYRASQGRLEEELIQARREVQQLQAQLSQSVMGQSVMQMSVAPVAELPPQERLIELEQVGTVVFLIC